MTTVALLVLCSRLAASAPSTTSAEALVAPAASATISVAPATLAPTFAASSTDIVFPPPPDPPRIRYLQRLATPQDLGEDPQSTLRKIWNYLLGRKPPRGFALARPYGVAVDDKRVYVADTDGTAVVVFDLARRQLTRFGGTREGRLLAPIGVAVTEGGTVYVTDSSQDVIKAFGPDGTFLAAYHILSGLKRPTGIAYDRVRRRLIVADTGNSRVLVCDPAGKLLREIGGRGTDPGLMSVPVNVAVDGAGRIFVVDPILCRVQRFSAEGVFEAAFGERGNMAGQFARPRGIAIDSEGHLHVTDALFNAVQVFDQDGRILMFYGGGGDAPATFDIPGGVAIDAQDRVFVVDTMNRRVQVFQYLVAPVDGGH